MRRTGIPGTRSWLIAQMQHGIHVEECATVRHERSMMPSAVVLQDDAICGVYKPHNESLQEVLSSGSDISISFEIRLRDIVDIKVRQDFMAHREKINGKQCPEVVYIFYSYDEEDIASCCTIHPATSKLSKIVLSLWHARIIKNCLNVPFVKPTAVDDPITREYYQETVLSLKQAESRQDLIEVLQEFAGECQSDTSLKGLAFETLDIFIVLQSICRGALFQPEPGSRRTFQNAAVLWASCLDTAEQVGARRADDRRAVQLNIDKLEAELLERFILYEAALNVMVSLLFGSDVVHLKHRIIEGPSPLTMSSWLPILACDVQFVLSDILGFTGGAEGQEVGALAMEEEILRSVRSVDGSAAVRSSTQIGLGTDEFLRDEFLRTSAESVRGSQRGHSLTLRAGSLLQGPSLNFLLQRRVQRQLLFVHTSSVELMRVRQTTLDLQSLMLNFLSEMTFFGRNRNPRPSNQISVGRSAGAAGMAIDSVGECFVRVGNWGVFLEDIVVRCSVIIDDFMNSPSVSAELKKQNLSRSRYLKKKKETEVDNHNIRSRLARGGSARKAKEETSTELPSTYVPTSILHDPTTHSDGTGHNVRFEDSTEPTPENSHKELPTLKKTGFVPVPMSPKKPRRSFINEVTVAKEESKASFWERRNKKLTDKDTAEKVGKAKVVDGARPEQLGPTVNNGPVLETQLICFLARDCTQMRKYLENDLKDYIVAIVCCLRYLCPLKRQYNSVILESARIVKASEAAAAALEKEKEQDDSSSKTEGKEESKTKSAIQRALEKKSDGKNEVKVDKKDIASKKDKAKDLTAWLNEPLELTTDRRSQKRMQCLLAEFEEPRFNLTHDAWKLMLLSSLQLEAAFDSILDNIPLDVSDLFSGGELLEE